MAVVVLAQVPYPRMPANNGIPFDQALPAMPITANAQALHIERLADVGGSAHWTLGRRCASVVLQMRPIWRRVAREKTLSARHWSNCIGPPGPGGRTVGIQHRLWRSDGQL